MSSSFIPMPTRRIISAEGNPHSKIAIIGEAGGKEEDRLQLPFKGPAGSVLDSCLQAAQVNRRDCYITNVVKITPRGNDISPYFNERSGAFTPAGREWLDILEEELKVVTANVLVPLGKVALSALYGNSRISKYRGYVCQGLPRFGSRKLVPAYHPAASLRGQYILRYYITADLIKARLESESPDIVRPTRKLIVPSTFGDACEWLGLLTEYPIWACDIEVVNFEVSAIGFAPSAELAISIPMYHEIWTEQEEAHLWKLINGLMNGPAIKIFQNGIFDMHFLCLRNGIHVQPPFEDTMVAHSVQYPEMLKGLEFLVSLHCGAQQYYKDMVKWDNIKKEA